MFYIKIPFDSNVAAEIAMEILSKQSELFNKLSKDITEEAQIP